MDVNLLKERFAALKQETVDTAVSNINGYRDFIGNGVAVGKLAEPIIAQILNDPDHHIFSFPFVFTGKNPPFDILVYEAGSEISKEKFTAIRSQYSSNYRSFHAATTEIVGGPRWCGVSLKNYINEEAQISTNYALRNFCEEELGDTEAVYADKDLVKRIYGHVKDELGHETILFLNSFPATKRYQFAVFDPDSINIDEIEYRRLTKHARYIFRSKGEAVFHIKYGKNQANPYQRGVWVDDLAQLPLLRKGEYVTSDFGAHILKGALEIHAPVKKRRSGLLEQE